MPHDAYLRLPVDGVESIRSRAEGRHVEVMEGKPYCRVEWTNFEPPERWLRDTSRALRTDALWLAFQKQADAFAFQHWAAGELTRRLAYGIKHERVWESADGVPEPWEADVLFSPRALERRVKVFQVVDMPAKDRDKAIDDLKRIWSERRIEVGTTEPNVSASSAGPAIIRHFDLPLGQ